MKKIIFIILAVTLFGCFEEESPIAPYDRGDVESNNVGMGVNYSQQLYFDLGTNAIVGNNVFSIWDLGFDCSEDSYHIILNTAKFAKIINVGPAMFDEDIPYDEALMGYDSPKGYTDSTAIGKWWQENEDGTISSKKDMYIINLGTDENLQRNGTRKLMIDDYDNETKTYTVSYSRLDGTEKQTVEVTKNSDVNFIYLSMLTNKVLNLEPPKLQWDIFFSKHTEMLEYDDDPKGYLEYSVTSVLLNQKYVEAAHFRSDRPFKDITVDVIDTLNFTNHRNAIGHEWKYYDFEQGYVVFSDIIYIIKDTEGFYYKLHFIDFYNDEGEKGYPKFEFQKI